MSKDTNSPNGHIISDLEGSICWITFCNPSRMNALNAGMWAALPGLIADAEAEDAVRVVVLRGAGTKAFSAGADISEFASARTGEAAKTYNALNHAAFGAVMRCAKPTIAMVRGYCMGGGLELAMCCDLRFAGESASFAIPSAKLGIGYDPRWIAPLFSALSPSQVKEVLFTGRKFTGAEALRMGMISRLCVEDALESETRKLAQEIAQNAPLAVRAAKRCIDEFQRHPENPDMAALDKLVAECFASEDYAEGQKAFAEKRKPVFRGK